MVTRRVVLIVSLLLFGNTGLPGALQAEMSGEEYGSRCVIQDDVLSEMESVLEPRHSRLGWWLVIQRMCWLNGAEVPDSATIAIVSCLASTRPAGTVKATLEYLLALLLAISVSALLYIRGRHVFFRRSRHESYWNLVPASVASASACVSERL